MKRTLLTALLLAFGLAQASAVEWLTDLAKAKEQAKKENKVVLMNFTGSDWWGFCIKLEKEVFGNSDFAEYASKNLVLVDVDFPHKKKQSKELKKANEKLQEQYKVEGFPTVVLLDADGKKIGEEVGYDSDEGPKAYLKKLDAMVKKAKK
jgi:thioredoxin-related protein